MLRAVLVLAFALAAANAVPLAAQSWSLGGGRAELLAVPLINNTPTLGFGVGVGAGLIYPVSLADSVSPPSVTGFGGLYTTTQSWILRLNQSLFLKRDRYRIKFGIGGGRLNFDYEYQDLPYRLKFGQPLLNSSLRFEVRAWSRLYLGVDGWVKWADYVFDQGSAEEQQFADAFLSRLGAEETLSTLLGPVASFDSRTSQFYPVSGSQAEAAYRVSSTSLGSDFDYQTLEYFWNYFRSVGPGQVLALRAQGRNTFGDVPFAALSMYGSRGDLRGYEAGKFRGRNMATVQAEYRWMFKERWGVVGFAGTGRLYGGTSEDPLAPPAHDGEDQDLALNEPLPSIGAGLRWRASTQRGVNLRLDVAWGRFGNHGIYFGIGEAF
jgi:hypothetical protein